jgi:pimeloyl-ACP methyl ester carboxylesterase
MSMQTIPVSSLCALLLCIASGCSSEVTPSEGDSDAGDTSTELAPIADAAFDVPERVDTDTATADGSTEPAGVPVNLGAPDVDLQSVAGLQVHELTYTVPGLNIERTLEVRLWYATDDETGETAFFEPRVPIFSDEFAWTDATVLPPPASTRAPLMVYSHGGRGFAGQISTVARQFVRNGWVVVAPSHPGQNLFDFQEILPYSFPAIRAYDTLAALDFMENLPAEHPLSGRVDTSRVLAMGHSYGGQNSWLLAGLPLDIEGITARCADGCTPEDIAAFEAFRPEPRVVAGVSLDNLIDPNLFLDESFAEMTTPMLHISGTEGNDGADIFRRAADANMTWVSLIGGCHESTTGTLPCDTLDLAISLQATSVYTVAFATRHVLGSTDEAVLGILDGARPVSSSAVLQQSAGVP